MLIRSQKPTPYSLVRDQAQQLTTEEIVDKKSHSFQLKIERPNYSTIGLHSNQIYNTFMLNWVLSS